PFGSMYGVIPDIIILGGIGALTLIIFLPFFGVVSPKDEEFLKGFWNSINLSIIGDISFKILMKIFFISPFNKSLNERS
ncbi:MAG: hypothetical protein ACTSU2_01880, partial [Promethearchaeota archaeon]